MCPAMSSAIDSHLSDLLANLSAGRASGVKLKDGIVSLVLDVGGLDEAARDQLAQTMKDAARGVEGVQDVRVVMTAQRSAAPIIVAVASGKGGVGKSTVSANLAVALKALGKRVGMVDADIQGPSLPRLLGTEGVKPQARNEKLVPVPTALGIPLLSMGFLAAPGQAIAWRGAMMTNALGQLIDADWGGTDIIIVDLPPGTGDIQLTMIQRHKPVGAVIVSTPQDLALIDATRAVSLFNQADVPIIGMVENMAGYVCPHCGGVSDPFGSGGAEAEAAKLGLDFLGRVPLDIAIRTASDAGAPPAAGTDAIGLPFRAIAERVAHWLDQRTRSGSPLG
jgi:ATP-binding protein involved in chromosome partitioning